MSDKKEFENLLAVLGERELSESENARLWQLIELKPERTEEYMAAQQMNFTLEDLGLSVVSDEQITRKEKIIETKNSVWKYIAAIAVAALIVVVFFYKAPQKTETAKVIVEKPDNEGRSLEEEYIKKVNEIPVNGSLNRPPTEFSSIKGEGGEIEFNKDIRPILADNCISCHGPDAKSREADLRLDTYEGILADKTVVPGKPEKSELIARVFTDDEDDIMPPPDSHKTLTEKQKDTLKKWVEAGAPWQKHWAYVKPVQPKVKAEGSPIDFFIAKKLKSKGLKMNKTADRYDLARRAAFDLTGLPPDPKLLSTFILDQNPGAYESFIDKLLESSHYGEHMARYWLDAARYGDTHGMHLDNYREIWPYRDWVIKAFNSNMPFNQFTVEQLAGDLLPNPTTDQLIATGFNRCNVTTSEGGAIIEELDMRYMVDRVETTTTVFMGMTAGCAACHDHKFDPISQREFYQLGAFFNNTTQPAMDGNQKDTPPVLTIPVDNHKEEWQKLLSERVEANRILERTKDNQMIAAKWWDSSEALNTEITEGRLFELLGDNRSFFNGQKIDVEIPEDLTKDPLHPSGKPAGIRFTDNNSVKVGQRIEIATDKPFTISMWIRSPDVVKNMNVIEIVDKKQAFRINMNYQGGINPELTTSGGRIANLLAGEMALMPRSWQHLSIRYSGGQSKTSFHISLDGEVKTLRMGNEIYIKNGKFSGDIVLGKQFSTGGLSHVRFYNRFLSNDEIKLQSKEFDFKSTFSAKPGSWQNLNDDQRKLVNIYYMAKVDEKAVAASKVLAKTQTRRDYIYSRSITTLITEEKFDSIPTAYVLERGEYDRKKERVTPDVPQVFQKMSPDLPRNRLGLAKWLVSPHNPLTARVTVNRLWQNLFGTGLVKTSEDFGSMGSQPTHPELLDWLAVEFVKSGWDVRHMLRLMVTSKAYRQSSVISSQVWEKDPDNLLISRGPRFRLDAEEIRDQALTVSGLLNRKIGGASVKPYQPAGLWKVVAFGGSNTKNFKADTGDKLYRRSVYTFWKRTSPPPSMAAFDAPTREGCTVRRERTNTPLQALVLMNDTQFVEAARYLAERSLKEKSIELERLQWLFYTVIGRPASPDDIKDLSDAVSSFRRHFSKTPKVSEALVKTGDHPADEKLDVKELASWTMIVNILMNRDDFINN